MVNVQLNKVDIVDDEDNGRFLYFCIKWKMS